MFFVISFERRYVTILLQYQFDKKKTLQISQFNEKIIETIL